MPATVPEIIKMFYNCEGERQTFACRLLTQVCPPSSEGLPFSCEGSPPSSVLLQPCCVVWRGTRKRRHQGGITALWDGRPTLRDGRVTWCAMGRQTDAMGRQTDAMGRQTDAMGRQTDAMGRQTDAIGR